MVISSVRKLALAPVIALGMWLVGCDSTPTGSRDPHAPYPPHALSPANRASDQPTALTLSWSGGDPDGDPVSYRLRIGDSPQMNWIDTVLTDSIYHLPYLGRKLTYYWQVVASDTTGRVSSSRQWTFSTWNHVIFPLVSGSGWRYHFENYLDNFAPESLATNHGMHVYGTDLATVVPPLSSSSAAGQFYAYTEQMVETVATSLEWVDTLWQVNYLQNHEDGLYNYGWDGYGFTGATPKVAVPQVTFRVGLLSFRSSAELVGLLAGVSGSGSSTVPGQSEAVGNPALDGYRTLAYPLKTGAEWSYRSWNLVGDIVKSVTGRQHITVPAGTFDCFKVKWTYLDEQGEPTMQNVEFYDYISEAGLVKRSIHITGLRIVTTDRPEGIGTVDWIQEFVLIDRFYVVPLDPGDFRPVR